MESKTPTAAEVLAQLRDMRDIGRCTDPDTIEEMDNPTDFYHGRGRELDLAVNGFNEARKVLLKAAAAVAEQLQDLPTEQELEDYIVPRPGYNRFYGGSVYGRNRPDYSKCGVSVNTGGGFHSHQCRNTANCKPDDQGRMTRCGVHKNRGWSRYSTNFN